MNTQAPSFEQVYVVSDLHLGGAPGRQIFNLGTRLGAMIRRLGQAEPPVRRALVVNGDFVDFLAEEPAQYFDASRAIEKLERIVADPNLSPVFQALREYVATERRYLVIVLGNHDVELALPHVKQWLTAWLSNPAPGEREEQVEARLGRIIWATDGAGFACTVGTKRVLCIHGNEFDEWNVVDYRALLQYTRALNRGQGPAEWSPNGGTRLVIDVMNDVKRTHAMVDLLKPETKAAVPMILAFSPEFLSKAGAALRAASVQAADGIRMAVGLLGEGAATEERRPTETEVLIDALGGVEAPVHATSTKGLIPPEVRAAQHRIDQRRPLPASYGASAPVETLGLKEWWQARSQPTLRAVMEKWLANDKTFDIGEEDPTFRDVDDAIGSGVHYVLAGHTHLRRALRRRWPGCYYFNTGTWIRLIQIDKKFLASDDSFAQVVDVLKGRSLQELDGGSLGGVPLVKLLPTVGAVEVQNGTVVARLCDVDAQGDLKTVPGASFS